MMTFAHPTLKVSLVIAVAMSMLTARPALAQAPPEPSPAAPDEPAQAPASQAAPASQPGAAVSDTPPPVPVPGAEQVWFYLVERQKQGPVAESKIRALYQEKKLFADTMVWRKSMGRWGSLVNTRTFTDLVDWHYVRNGRKLGPVNTTQLRTLVKAGVISSYGKVWRRGLKQWRPLNTLKEMSGLVYAARQAPAHETPGARPVEIEAGGEAATPTAPCCGNASSGRANLPRSDFAGSAYAESHFYALGEKFKATGGRLVVGARVPIKEVVTLGIEMVVPWVAPESGKGDDEVVFANLAISIDGKVFGGDKIYGLVGLKVYFPVLGEFSGNSEMMTDLLSYAANPYEIGFYIPYTLTLRPDFKLYSRFSNNFVVGGEMGFDFLIAISDDKVSGSSSMSFFRKENFILNWHFGAKVGYVISEMFFPFFELSMSKMAYISDGDASDASVLFNLGPGFHFQHKNFEAGFTLQIPTNDDITELLKVMPCVKVGGRF